MTLSPCENGGVDIFSYRNLSDFEYADDEVLGSKDSCNFLVGVDHLNESVGMFRLFKMLLQ